MASRKKSKNAGRVPWHVVLCRLLLDRGPRNFQVIAEFALSKAPSLIDFLLLRRTANHWQGKARVLRGLWPRLKRVAIVEYKSRSRPFRIGDLIRLHGCARFYHSSNRHQIRLNALSIVLLVPSRTPALDADLKELGWSLESLGQGYWSIRGCDYPGLVAFLDDVSDAEEDDLIGVFGHHKIASEASAEWLTSRGGVPTELAMAKVDGFKAFVVKLTKSKEARDFMLSSMAPEHRLEGLSRDETALALPNDVLRAVALSPDYLATLSPKTRRTIARRLKRPTRH